MAVEFLKQLFSQAPTQPENRLQEIALLDSQRLSATYNIDRFTQQNLIRSSKFAARFLSVPSFVTELKEDTENMLYLCDSIEFHGQSLTALEYKIPGKLKVKVPFNRDANEVTFTFYINDSTPIYGILSNWIYEISPNNVQNRYFDEIVGQIELLMFEDTTSSYDKSSPNAFKHMSVNLIDAYPLNVQSMPANWMDDGFHKVTASFFFRDLELTSRK